MDPLDAEIDLYLRVRLKVILKTIKRIYVLEIHKENSPPEIVQMILSDVVNETDTYDLSDFSHREHHANPDSDTVRVLRAPIDDDMLVFVLRHINDYEGIDMNDNNKQYPRMIADKKVLISTTLSLNRRL